jgi:O-succinylhomoserine sulfhydrylase
MKKKITEFIHKETNRSVLQETSLPLYLTSGYVYNSAQEAAEVFDEKKDRYQYSRFNNPTVNQLEKKFAELEGAESCRAFSSGMAAVFASLMCQIKKGDRVVASRALFGSCYNIIKDILPKYGIEVVFIDGKNLKQWENAINKKTSCIFFETPSNPTLEIVDIESVSEIAHRYNAKVIVDNVFASSVLQKPLNYGADIVVYSTTKHIDGQGRTMGGLLLSSKKFYEEKLKFFYRNTGPTMDTFTAWILLKSLETYPLRIEHLCKNASRVAFFLKDHPKIQKTIFPGLAEFPQKKLVKKQMDGFGNMISFYIKGNKNTTFKFLNNLSLIIISNNLGDVKSLIIHPASTTHLKILKKDKNFLNINNKLVRLSVGLENVEDIIKDIDLALKKV